MGVRLMITKKGKMYRAELMVNGKRFSQNFKRKQDAESYLKGLEVMRAAHSGSNQYNEVLTFGKAWATLVDQKRAAKLNPETIKIYIGTAKIFEHLMEKNVLEISKEDIVDAVDKARSQHTGEHLSRRRLFVIKVYLKYMFEVAENLGFKRNDLGEIWSGLDGIIQKNGQRRKQTKAYSQEQVDRLISVKIDKEPHWVKPLVLFLLITGKRIGEAMGLTTDKIDFENKKILINQMINHGRYYSRLKCHGPAHSIEMDDLLIKIFTELKERTNNPDSPWVFASLHKNLPDFPPEDKCPYKMKPIVSSNAQKYIKRRMIAAGVPVKRVHDLRKTAGTLAFLRYGGDGVAKGIAQRMLNHLTTKTTEIYLGISDETLDNRINGAGPSSILDFENPPKANTPQPSCRDNDLDLLRKEKEKLELLKEIEELKKQVA